MAFSIWKKTTDAKPAEPKGPVREWVDAIVFAVLAATLIRWATFEAYTEDMHPPDLRMNYIKRCIGVAGDEIVINNRQVSVNGKPADNPPQMQYKYFVIGTDVLNEETFTQRGIQEPMAAQGGYVIDCTPAVAEELKQLPFVRSIGLALPDSAGVADPRIFPNNADANTTQPLVAPRVVVNWNKDNYGPIRIPKKGDVVQLTAANTPIYLKVILRYEDNPGVTYTPADGLLHNPDGSPLTQYTIRQNYYWMMGDNRHNSEDSRFWGFVPEEQIVGKAVFIWMSSNPHPEQGGSSIRWNRLFSVIH